MSRRVLPRALVATVSLSVAVVATPAGAATDPGIGMPPSTGSEVVAPTVAPCVVDAAAFITPGTTDDTSAFAHAIARARAKAPNCFTHGPTGAPQAVVHVPAGVYHLADLRIGSNVRLEVDAGATLEPVALAAPPATPDATPLISVGNRLPRRPAVVNVSVVGVGADLDARKQAAYAQGGPITSFDLSADFTMDLDPVDTNSSNYVRGIDVTQVEGFVIQNVLALQNGTDQAAGTTFAWPTSGRQVLAFHAPAKSPLAGPFLEPENGEVRNIVDLNAPRGFGPTQVNAGVGLDFRQIYSEGGTALRIETDDSMNGRGELVKGAEVDRLTASDIVGVNCNRAVSLSPHAQRNGSVSVDGVWAYSCNESVVAAFDEKAARAGNPGSFSSATVTDVSVDGGPLAQLDSTSLLWTVGQSYRPVAVDKNLPWQPTIEVVRQAGTFTG